jgi:hypothetical protein
MGGRPTVLIAINTHTRQEVIGNRNTELFFSGWIRENLPEANTGFAVSDIDFILYDYTLKTIMIIELKTHNAKLQKWQKSLLTNLHKWLKKGIASDPEWQYLGTHLIRFTNTNFHDGQVYLDNKLSNEQEIKLFLSGEIIKP